MPPVGSGSNLNDHELIAFEALVGFVDLSGFTTASERLGQLGPHGTEQMRGLINALFTPAIDIVHRAGGEIGWFAGDAMGVLFESDIVAPERGLNALDQLSKAIHALPPVETAAGPLTMGAKIGVAAGGVEWHRISSEPRVSWFGGAAVELAGQAEHHAEPEQVIIDPSVADGLVGADGFEVTPIPDTPCSLLLSPPEVGSVADSGARSRLAPLRDPRFQPPRVFRLVSRGEAAFLDEHRPVTVLFVGFSETSHDPAQLSEARLILANLGGLTQATEGDKGAMALGIFGAPTALADRHSRALHAADRLRETFPRCTIGVTSGLAFAGRIGSANRWDYSVLGDRINTAARFMQAAAPGEILLDTETDSALGATIVRGKERVLQLKGKASPERVTPVVGVRSRTAPDSLRPSGGGGLFVGRQDETETLLKAATRPGITLVSGRAGTGKSRLLAHALDLRGGHEVEGENRTSEGPEPSFVRLEQTDRGQPLVLWRRLLPAIAGVEGAALIEALPRRFEEDPRIPLLAPLAGIYIPDSGLTASLDPGDRVEVLASFLVEVLAVIGQGSFFVVEDLHWADGASIELLQALAGRLSGTGAVMMATTRPEPEIQPLVSSPAVEVVALPGIDEGAMAQLARHLWTVSFGQEPLGSLTADVVERSGGSPLFCEQLVSFARAKGVPAQAEVLPEAAGVPTTLTDLVLARLDSLPQDAVSVASFGSVLGAAFTASDLRGAFSDFLDWPSLLGGLEILRDRGILVGLDDYRFSHSLFRETTYERLSYSLRAELHLSALVDLESGLIGDNVPEQLAPELARHAERTDDDDRKRRYFKVAAEQAEVGYANDVASYWYRQLIDLEAGENRGTARLAVGKLAFAAGDLKAAETLLVASLDELSGPELVQAKLWLARVQVQLGAVDEGFLGLDEVIRSARLESDWTSMRAGLENKADLATLIGDVERAEEVERAVEQVTLSSPESSLGRIWGLVPLHWLRGDYRLAIEAHEEWVAHCLANGDLPTAGRAVVNLAGLHHELGDVSGCLENMARAKELFQRTGQHADVVRYVDGNEAGLLRDLGEFDRARERAMHALAQAIELEGVAVVAPLLSLLGSIPETEMRWELLGRSVVLFCAVGDRLQLLDALHRLANVAEESNDLATSERILEWVTLDATSAPLARYDLLRLYHARGQAGLEGRLRELAAECSGTEVEVLAVELVHRIEPSAVTLAQALKLAEERYRSFPSNEIRCVLDRLATQLLPAPSFGLVAEAAGDVPELRVLLSRVDEMPELRNWRADFDERIRSLSFDTGDQLKYAQGR